MIYVDIKDKAKDQRESFRDSYAQITFWYYNDGHKELQNARLDPTKYNGERYWVVGCVGKANDKQGGIYTDGFQNFFNGKPEEEMGEGYCNKNLLNRD